ncbi:MAG: carboxypeptidase regulatory-like domain-containing protein [Planctomycetota bacterium]
MKLMKTANTRTTWLALTGLAISGCGLSDLPPVTITLKPAEEGAAAKPDAATEASPAAATETAAATGGTGDLVGTVLFDGAPPSLAPVVAMGGDVKDKAVCSVKEIPDESLVVDAATKGIQNVFVFFEKAPAGAAAVPAPEKQIFDQEGCKFVPHAVLVRTKVPLLVLSDDAVGHNTHTYPARNTSFNGAISANERKGVPITYTQPEREPFKVTCDVHPWMSAYHLPLDHGYAAVTDAQGKFTIKGLPAGSHVLKVWHESGKLLERGYKVTVKPGDNPVELKYGAAKFGK